MKTLQKILMGLVLVPFTLASFYHFALIYYQFNPKNETLKNLALGMLFYSVLEFLFKRPMRSYVLGHELSHALATWICGGKVHSFKVSKDGGYVRLSKSNFFISLAPYCFPIYTLLGLIFYWVLKFFYFVEPYEFILVGFVGASLAFHVSLTIFAIRQGQPDIKGTGIFFSLIFILFSNVWVLILLSKLLFPELFEWDLFLRDVWKTQIIVWGFILSAIESRITDLKNLIAR